MFSLCHVLEQAGGVPSHSPVLLLQVKVGSPELSSYPVLQVYVTVSASAYSVFSGEYVESVMFVGALQA